MDIVRFRIGNHRYNRRTPEKIEKLSKGRKNMKKRIASIILSLVMLLSLLPVTALAATTTTVDSFEGLQNAITNAANGDTIQLDADIDATATITILSGKNIILDLNGHVIDRGLTKGDTPTGAANGHVIKNEGTLTITDSNPNVEHKFAEFNLSLSGETAKIWRLDDSGEVVVKGGCITGGYCANSGELAACGGGVYNKGTLTLEGGNIVGNVTYAGSAEGGGIYNEESSSFTMTGGRVSYNVAYSNTTDDASSFGGGIDNNEGTAYISGGEISHNIVSKLIYTGSVVSAYGGGVANRGTLTITGTVKITENLATAKGSAGGGGGVSSTQKSTAVLLINGGEIFKNESNSNGGAMYLATGTATIAQGADIHDNTAVAQGGGVVIGSGTLTMTGGKIYNNKTTSNSTDGGGGVTSWKNGTFIMTGGEIYENRSNTDGGGITNKGTLKLSGTAYIHDNTSVWQGGGVYPYNSDSKTYLGGAAKITGNTRNSSANNLFVASDTLVELGTGADGNGVAAPAPGMSVGVTMGTPGPFTTNGAAGDVKYFFSDDAACYVNFNKSGNYLELKKLITTYNELITAIDSATDNEETRIVLGDNITCPAGSCVNIPENKDIVLDLNGYVLNRGLIASNGAVTNKEQGSAISVAGKLTVTDSNTGGQFHKFKLESGLWVLDEADGTKIVTGGVITGGTGTHDTAYIGGGIMVTGTGDLTIEDGNIIGNTATIGGGVEVAAGGSLTMHGGTVTGNTAAAACGGIHNAGTLNMKGKIIIKENVCESGVNNLGTTSPITLEGTDNPYDHPSLANSTKIYAALVDASGEPSAGVLTSGGENAPFSLNSEIFYDGSTNSYLTKNNADELEVKEVPGEYHAITIRPSANGSISVQNNDLEDEGYNGAIGKSGDTISVTRLWPDTGYQLKSVGYYVGEDYTSVKAEDGYTFEMPDNDITVCAEYELSTFGKLGQAVSFKSSAGVDQVFTVEDDPETGIRTVKLLTDVSGSNSDAALEVPAGKEVVFDLNGHALNRGMIQKNTEDSQWASFGSNEKGSVFLVNGTLTVIDSTPTTTHRFTKRLSDTFPLTVLDEEARSDYIVCRGGVITGGTGCLDQELGALEFNNWQEKTVGPYSGGGIFIGETGVVNLNGGTVIGNASAKYICWRTEDDYSEQSDFGGGVLVKGEFNMKGSAVTGNATGSYGGGIYVAPTGSLTMKDSTVSDNKVNGSSFGGGIYCRGGMKIEDSVISGNSTEHSGGGIAVVSTDSIEIINSDIADNATTSWGGYGGGIYVYNTNTTLQGVKFHGNRAGSRGGAIAVCVGADNSYTTVLEDVDICENSADGTGSAVYIEQDENGHAAVKIHNAVISGNTGGSAVQNGGNEYGGELHLSGKVIIKGSVDNSSGEPEPSRNLATVSRVIIDGALTDSEIYLTRIVDGASVWTDAAGELTSGYTAKNPGAKVDDFFHYDGPISFYMDLESNELVVKNVPDGYSSVSVPSSANGKVTADQYVVADSAEGNARTVTLTVTPDEGYQLKSLKYNDGQDHDITSAKSFTMPTTNVIVTAEFRLISTPVYYGGESSYSITTENAENGTFTLDKKSASAGQTVTITVTPDKGFTLETLTVLDKNGKEVEVKNLGNNKFSFTMPSGKVSISATFMEDNTMLNFFVDVKAGDYFYDAVLWAAENGITKGTDAVHFSPNAPVTRAQVVTFLWRAAGCPEPVGDASRFVDVEVGGYYEKAVAWAIEQVITKGTSETTFTPDAVCTRGQIAAFLARFAGVADEAAGYTHDFTDVKATDYFNNAVAWAKNNKVTEGTSTTTFSPNDDCIRAQVVTFLYRWMVK